MKSMDPPAHPHTQCSQPSQSGTDNSRCGEDGGGGQCETKDQPTPWASWLTMVIIVLCNFVLLKKKETHIFVVVLFRASAVVWRCFSTRQPQTPSSTPHHTVPHQQQCLISLLPSMSLDQFKPNRTHLNELDRRVRGRVNAPANVHKLFQAGIPAGDVPGRYSSRSCSRQAFQQELFQTAFQQELFQAGIPAGVVPDRHSSKSCSRQAFQQNLFQAGIPAEVGVHPSRGNSQPDPVNA